MTKMFVGTMLTVISVAVVGCAREDSQVETPVDNDSAVVSSSPENSTTAVEHQTMKPVVPTQDASADEEKAATDASKTDDTAADDNVNAEDKPQEQ